MPTFTVSNVTELINRLNEAKTNATAENVYELKQTADITISTAPSFDQELKKYIIYDGQGFAIRFTNTGTITSQSIFGRLENCTLRNIYITNSSFGVTFGGSNVDYSGILARTLKNCTLENIEILSNGANITVAGYIVGFIAGMAEDTTIKYVRVNQINTSYRPVLLPYSVDPTYYTLAGGLFGLAIPNMTIQDVDLKNFTIDVTNSKNDSTFRTFVGGVIGAIPNFGGTVNLTRIVAEPTFANETTGRITAKDGIIGQLI